MSTPPITLPGGFICPNCGTCAWPKKVARGSFLLEVVLWLCFLLPGFIYSMWRLTTKQKVCPSCRQPGMAPVNSPIGRELVQRYIVR